LEDYLKAAEHLTLDSDRFNMQEKPNKDFIKGILDEKDQQLDVINKKYDILQSQFQTILSSLNQLDQSSKNMLAKKMFHDGIYKPMH
jgi:hypothetical protein